MLGPAQLAVLIALLSRKRLASTMKPGGTPRRPHFKRTDAHAPGTPTTVRMTRRAAARGYVHHMAGG